MLPPYMDVTQLRSETRGCSERNHLNNAGASLMPDVVTRTITDYIQLESRIGGYEAEAASTQAFERAYQSVADLLHTQPRNIAFTENATASFAQALSSVPFEPGDIILTTRNDYASNQIQFLSMKSRMGVRVLRAPDRPEGGVDVEAMGELIRRRRPTLVCVTHIPTNSGLVQDVNAIGAICREEDVLYLVDACQSVGQMPVDVTKIACDYLSATSRKFLRGPRGSGFLYVSDRVLDRGLAPLFPDMGGANWTSPDQYDLVATAKRFENWEFAYALVLGTGEAARYAMSVGLGAIRDRVRLLADGLRESLSTIGGVRVLDRGRELGGIVTVALDGYDPATMVAVLRKRGINTSSQVRTSAVIDYDAKGVSGALRLSPHYFNTEEECGAAVEAIAEELAVGS